MADNDQSQRELTVALNAYATSAKSKVAFVILKI